MQRGGRRQRAGSRTGVGVGVGEGRVGSPLPPDPRPALTRRCTENAPSGCCRVDVIAHRSFPVQRHRVSFSCPLAPWHALLPIPTPLRYNID